MEENKKEIIVPSLTLEPDLDAAPEIVPVEEPAVPKAAEPVLTAEEPPIQEPHRAPRPRHAPSSRTGLNRA